MSVSPTVVAEVQQLIDACYKTKTMPLELAWSSIVEVWKQHGLAYETEVHVCEMICHPDNRPGSWLNGHKAHKTGADVSKTGCVPSKLYDAFAFEVWPMEPKCTSQMDFNRTQVLKAGGLLADVTGTERFLGVNHCHFVAFLKAALAGCKTNQKSIMDGTGKINIGYLR